MNKLVTELGKIGQLIYDQLGPSYSEYVYHRALELELRKRGIFYESEKNLAIKYRIGEDLVDLSSDQIDLYIPENGILIEIKATSSDPKQKSLDQLGKYARQLRLQDMKCETCILINFPQSNTKRAKRDIDYIIYDTESYSDPKELILLDL
jgi:GxxExxY protein